MPKASKKGGGKGKVYALPTALKKRDGGVPKLTALKDKRHQTAPYTKGKPAPVGAKSIAALAGAASHIDSTYEDAPGAGSFDATPVDSSLTIRDSSAKAFMRELRKVIDRADVIIQVLDARDPEGTRSKWVEDEVRKRDASGKKLLAVVNKIDLVPRENLELWLKHLRHSFPTMPFKSSTQGQRQHLSQNAVPLAAPAAQIGEKRKLAELPSTSSSLGAPALLHLLKQYALTTPHSALTVGVVGYPNVGKSSLINSLKRSRACGVAAMPGKTRIVQEVVLDKGVKILDCPGVVLEDIGREYEDGEDGRRKQAELMLRNCVKAELIDDPVSPVEVILQRTDPALMQKLYNVPPFDDVRDFLIKIALTRGRLGRGGIPDLMGSAVSVLRDWNSGKIPYFSKPPKVHASSMPQAQPERPGADGNDVAMEGGEAVGSAKILTKLSEAFTIDGLFDNLGDDAEWQGDDAVQEDITEDAFIPDAPEAAQIAPTAPAPKRSRMAPDSDDEDDSDSDSDASLGSPISGPSTLPSATGPSAVGAYMPLASARGTADPTRLFAPEELSALNTDVLDRRRQKQLAKKERKRRHAAERLELELTGGLLDMDVDEGFRRELEDIDVPMSKRQKQEKRKKKKKVQQQQQQMGRFAQADPEFPPEVAEEQKKESEFANFLATMGVDEDEEL